MMKQLLRLVENAFLIQITGHPFNHQFENHLVKFIIHLIAQMVKQLVHIINIVSMIHQDRIVIHGGQHNPFSRQVTTISHHNNKLHVISTKKDLKVGIHANNVHHILGLKIIIVFVNIIRASQTKYFHIMVFVLIVLMALWQML